MPYSQSLGESIQSFTIECDINCEFFINFFYHIEEIIIKCFLQPKILFIQPLTQSGVRADKRHFLFKLVTSRNICISFIFFHEQLLENVQQQNKVQSNQKECIRSKNIGDPSSQGAQEKEALVEYQV